MTHVLLNALLQRIRFEHPEIRCVVLTSARNRVFCSGANIYMLAQSSHAWKVNFCRFTNETRNGIEDASRHSGLKFIAPGPSNVYMFDVRDPAKPTRIAAVSVTESAEDGTVLKTRLLGTPGTPSSLTIVAVTWLVSSVALTESGRYR